MATARTVSSIACVRSQAMDVAGYLQALSEELTANHVTAAGLATLEFTGDDRVRIGSLEQPRLGGYPTLEAILDEIGCTCWADGVTLSQLRRLEFSDDAVGLELHGDYGGVPSRYRFPIDVFTRDD